MLKRLERQLDQLPEGMTKHDMEPGFNAMAVWVAGLDRYKRAKLLSELPRWLADEDHPWHSRAALEIAVRQHDPRLLEAAISEARRRGIHDLEAADTYPSWLLFDLNLLSAISRWPGQLESAARAFLNELRSGATDASDFPRRLLGIRAWFTQCLFESPDCQADCIEEGLSALRAWQNARLMRSALTLLHSYFGHGQEGIALLRRVLHPQEFVIAFPELAAS